MLMHIDGDAFFASVYQATHASAQGKPVIIGRERGIATAFSYEAKRRGVRRGMLGHEVKKLCPEAIFVMSDYRMYQIFSNKMVAIAEQVSPHVERYSIDEVFIDITGLDRVYNTTYFELGNNLKKRIERSLGLTVSAGIAPTKTLAKIASEAEKPSGFVLLNKENTEYWLQKTDIGDVWGVGFRLARRMHMLGIQNAYDLVHTSEEILRANFNKMVLQTWFELRGTSMYGLSEGKKTEYKSIRKTSTVTPATTDRELLLARIFKHTERAFVKARKHGYRVRNIELMLKTQKFTYHTSLIKLKEPVAYPYLIRDHIRTAFNRIYRRNTPYRATGAMLFNFEDGSAMQQSLFDENKKIEGRLKGIYPLYEKNLVGFGTDLLETHRHKSTKMFKNMSLG